MPIILALAFGIAAFTGFNAGVWALVGLAVVVGITELAD